MFRSEILAQNIKKCRVKMKLTQNELAERLFISGQAISKWESGQSVPDIENLCALSEIFSTSVDNLIGNVEGTSREKALIGIDGGATKTEFVLFDTSGNIIHRLCMEGSNPNVSGVKNSFAVLKSGIDTLLSMRPDVSGVYAGIAGYTSGNNKEIIDSFFEKSYPLMKVTVKSDICNVISSVIGIQKCIAVICGTGFSTFAYNGKDLTRVGAWGYLLDDIGGGFGIGREAIRAALAQRDGLGEETVITSMVEQRIGGEVWDNLNKVYSGGDSFIASFAPIVFDAYNMNDKKAVEIMNEYTDKMADLLEFTLNTYDCGKDIVISGGLMSDNNVIIDLLEEKIDRDVNFIKPEIPQIFGACYKCCEIYGIPDDDFYNNFNRNYSLTGVI